MSKFTHAMCMECWRKKHPKRDPVRIPNDRLALCCFCAAETKAGIYVREDPKNTLCDGRCFDDDHATIHQQGDGRKSSSAPI